MPDAPSKSVDSPWPLGYLLAGSIVAVALLAFGTDAFFVATAVWAALVALVAAHGAARMEGAVASMDHGIDRLDTGVSTLNQTVSVLQGSVSALDGAVTAMQGSVSTIEDAVSAMSAAVARLEWLTAHQSQGAAFAVSVNVFNDLEPPRVRWRLG